MINDNGRDTMINLLMIMNHDKYNTSIFELRMIITYYTYCTIYKLACLKRSNLKFLTIILFINAANERVRGQVGVILAVF